MAMTRIGTPTQGQRDCAAPVQLWRYIHTRSRIIGVCIPLPRPQQCQRHQHYQWHWQTELGILGVVHSPNLLKNNNIHIEKNNVIIDNIDEVGVQCSVTAAGGGQLEVLSDCKPIIHCYHNCCRPPSAMSFFCLPAAGHHQNFVWLQFLEGDKLYKTKHSWQIKWNKLNWSTKHRIPVLLPNHWTGRTRCMHLPHALVQPAAWQILALSLQSTHLVSHQPSSAQSRQVRLFVFHLICPCEMLDWGEHLFCCNEY